MSRMLASSVKSKKSASDSNLMRTTRSEVRPRPVWETLRLLQETSPVIGCQWTSSVRCALIMGRKGLGSADRQSYHQMEVSFVSERMEPVSGEIGNDKSLLNKPLTTYWRPLVRRFCMDITYVTSHVIFATGILYLVD